MAVIATESYGRVGFMENFPHHGLFFLLRSLNLQINPMRSMIHYRFTNGKIELQSFLLKKNTIQELLGGSLS